MSTYLIINLAIVIVPLILSFEDKVRYNRKFKYLFPAIAITAVPYLLWDALAAYRADWGFNEKYVLGIKIALLPVEEIMFFITVPFSSIFIYESLKVYLKDYNFSAGKIYFVLPGLLFVFAALFFTGRYYTFTVLLFSGFFLLSAGIYFTDMLRSRLYWIFIVFMFVPFLIVNYLLTSLPVVTYNPNAITGIRILTIPIEDFFYSFSMLSFYLLAYLVIRRKWQLKTG